jgi:beta-glucosidase/6-phospho-beta-glucosidase/beta-galactosidase
MTQGTFWIKSKEYPTLESWQNKPLIQNFQEYYKIVFQFFQREIQGSEFTIINICYNQKLTPNEAIEILRKIFK